MNFLKRLGKSLAGVGRTDADALWVHARCQRCSQVIGARISLRNDLSLHYNERGQPEGYHVRKLLVSGKRRCYHPIEVILNFDANRRLIGREITGGEFITAEQSAAESTGD